MPKRKGVEATERAFEVRVDQIQPDGSTKNVETVVPEDWFLSQIAMNEVGENLFAEELARHRKGQAPKNITDDTLLKREQRLVASLKRQELAPEDLLQWTISAMRKHKEARREIMTEMLGWVVQQPDEAQRKTILNSEHLDELLDHAAVVKALELREKELESAVVLNEVVTEEVDLTPKHLRDLMGRIAKEGSVPLTSDFGKFDTSSS